MTMRRRLLTGAGVAGCLVAAALVTGYRLTATKVVTSASLRPFGPGAPDPRAKPDPLDWRPDVTGGGRYAVYSDTTFRGQGVLRYSDSVAYLWDPSTHELLRISDHADPGVVAEVATDGSAVFFAEQRDPGTKRDGVNPDPPVKRLARWDRSTGLVTGVTEFAYGAFVDIALSGDDSTVAFIADARVFVGPTGGAVGMAEITPVRTNSDRGYGYAGKATYLSFNATGRLLAFTDLRGGSQVYLYDRDRGTSRSVLAMLPGDVRVMSSTFPSICGDGSRLAFIAYGTRSDGGQSQHAVAYVVDTGTDAVVARSHRGARRGIESQYARSALLSPDCRRLAYMAPGAYDGRDLDRHDTYKSDALVVVDVGSGKPTRVVTIATTPREFVAGPTAGLRYSDGATVDLE